MYRNDQKSLKDTGELVELLGFMCPGQDAQVHFRTKDRRSLSGYWTWDIIQLRHVHTPNKVIWARFKNKPQALRDYNRSIMRRQWRYKDAMKLLEKYRDGTRTVSPDPAITGSGVDQAAHSEGL